MKLILATTLFVSFTLLIANFAFAKKLYKWVDDKGNISYQDQPPPKTAKILSAKKYELEGSDKKSAETNTAQVLKPNVVVYTVDNCELCDKIIRTLNVSKVAHIALPLAADREAQNRILEGAGRIVLPSIFVGDQLIQGTTEQELTEKLIALGISI